MKRELERIEIPDEHEARTRAWAIVQAAHRERAPVVARRNVLRPALVLAAALAVVAAAVSPAGRAVVDEIREVVGVESPQRALFSLPVPGQLLVSSDAGVWVVQQNGSKRLLGEYRSASWSPFGRFVVATGENELAALEPGGDVRWTLARPQVGAAAWSGTRADTRIAYVTQNRLRVVGGDSRGDRLLLSAPDVPRAPFAWKPGSVNLLAHSTQGVLRLLDVRTGSEEVWSARVAQPWRLLWTADGERLIAVSAGSVVVFDARGRRVVRHALGGRITAAAIEPDAHAVAVAVRAGARTRILSLPLDRKTETRRLFAGAGGFTELSWSPDGDWLLAGWRDADQWVLLRPGGEGIRAVANVSTQFRSESFPAVEGWAPPRTGEQGG